MTLVERLRRRLRTEDAGTSLIELIVAMILMGIFMAMFTTAIVLMTGSADKVEAVTVSSGNVNQAFLETDRIVRYASALSTPGQAAGSKDWYVEGSIPGANGTSTCKQLRVDISTKQLQERVWSVSSSQVAGTAGSWVPLASGITNGSAASGSSTVPFSFPVNAASIYQQLTVTLLSAATAPATSTSTSTVTYTALNSTLSGSTLVCQQWGRP
jgi:type II secretory pathway pseudopilin PulG